MGITKYDEIYDESGIIVGRAPIGEQRNETELQDMFWCDCCDEFHAVGDDCPEPKHDANRYTVEEHRNTIERNAFVMEYLLLRDNKPELARQFRNGVIG